MANDIAGPGQVFVCGACGKVSRDRYGDQKISQGWDESCMLWANLCWEDHLVYHEGETRVREVKEGGVAQ